MIKTTFFAFIFATMSQAVHLQEQPPQGTIVKADGRGNGVSADSISTTDRAKMADAVKKMGYTEPFGTVDNPVASTGPMSAENRQAFMDQISEATRLINISLQHNMSGEDAHLVNDWSKALDGLFADVASSLTEDRQVVKKKLTMGKTKLINIGLKHDFQPWFIKKQGAGQAATLIAVIDQEFKKCDDLCN